MRPEISGGGTLGWLVPWAYASIHQCNLNALQVTNVRSWWMYWPLLEAMFWKDHAESGQMYCTCVYSTHLMNRFSTSCGVVPTLSGFVVVLGKVDIRAFNFQLAYTCVFFCHFAIKLPTKPFNRFWVLYWCNTRARLQICPLYIFGNKATDGT